LRKNPFLAQRSAFYGQSDLDVEKMERATTLLTSVSDFRAMCKQPQLYKHTRCQMSVAKLTRSEDGHRLRFDFTADRFLRNMVRLLVGNLLEVGAGRLSLEKFEWYLRNGERPKHFKLARPEGLYLAGVEYDNWKSTKPNTPPLP
jgi:tRNA pseudouridine38-40 synthase